MTPIQKLIFSDSLWVACHVKMDRHLPRILPSHSYMIVQQLQRKMWNEDFHLCSLTREVQCLKKTKHNKTGKRRRDVFITNSCGVNSGSGLCVIIPTWKKGIKEGGKTRYELAAEAHYLTGGCSSDWPNPHIKAVTKCRNSAY